MGKFKGISGMTLRITDLPAFARLVLTNPRSSDTSHRAFVKSRTKWYPLQTVVYDWELLRNPNGSNTLLRCELHPDRQVSTVGKRVAAGGEVYTCHLRVPDSSGPQRRLFRDTEKQKHVQSALRVSLAGPGTCWHCILDGSRDPPIPRTCSVAESRHLRILSLHSEDAKVSVHLASSLATSPDVNP